MYHIGQIHPSETLTALQVDKAITDSNLQNTETFKELDKTENLKEMRADFLNLRKLFFDMGLFETNYTFFFFHALHIVVFQILGFYILWNYGYSLVPLICALTFHIIAQVN